MIPGQLSDIKEALLASICSERWAESQTLDFKRDAPGTDEDSKQEFLKDVCAFANASGGDLVYGVQDKDGTAEKIVPIPIGKHPVDATKRRLLQVLESGLEPPVDVAVQAVPLTGGDYVVVIRVPASFKRPHRYRTKGLTRWVVRVDTHAVDLTYDQIRDAFDRTATLADDARKFRDGRLSGILSGTTGRPLSPGPKCVVHLIPLAAMAGKSSVDVGQLHNEAFQQFMFRDWGGASRSLNLDGLVVYPGKSAADLAYTQIFRTGAMEAARWIGALHPEDAEQKITIYGADVSAFIRDALTKFFTAATTWQIAGPAIACVALLDLAGWKFFYQPRGYFTQRRSPDRPNLLLPDIWIEQTHLVANPDEVIRPVLDTLWQCFDMERCPFYNAVGAWELH